MNLVNKLKKVYNGVIFVQLRTMLENKKASNIIQNKLTYILNDTMGIVIFVAILVKCIIFMNVIKSTGAAEFHLNFSDIAFEKTNLYLLFSFMLISIAFLFSKRAHVIVLVIINLLYSTLLVGDLWYYRGFQSFLSLHLFGETQNVNSISKAVIAMARPIDIIFVIDNVFIIVLAIMLRKKYKTINKEKGIFSVLFFIPLIILLTLHLRLDNNGPDYEGKTLFKAQYVPYATMLNLSPLGYHFYDTVLFAKSTIPQSLSDIEKSKIQKWLDYKNEKLPDNKYKGMTKGKNLIFIQVESLENFVVNKSYNGQVLTPNLNNLLKNSLYFSDFYEQVNSGNSADADLMVNASVLPIRNGSTFTSYPNNEYNTLPKLLKEENYSSKSLHAADGNIWNITNAFKSFHFDELLDMNNLEKGDMSYMGLTDESFLNQVLNLTDKEKKPFYYYAVTVSSHIPFEMPENMKGLTLPKEFDETHLGGYLQAINYSDRQIGSFIKKLDEKGVLKDSTIVIMGDHSGIHKYYNDEISKISAAEPWLDNNYRVPFIVYNKGSQGEEIKTTGAQIDILPTLAALMGVDKAKYENTSIGRNLLNTNKGYALLNDGTIIGADSLSKEDLNHIKESYEISDLIVKTNYFKSTDQK